MAEPVKAKCCCCRFGRNILQALIFPPFFKWLDQGLRLHFPIVWRTRIHHFVWFALLANPALYGLGCVYPAAALPTFFIPLLKIISYLLLALWALQQFRFPLGEFHLHEYLITAILYTCCFFITLITPVSFILPIIQRVAVISGKEIALFSLIKNHYALLQISAAAAIMLTLLFCVSAKFLSRYLKISKKINIFLPKRFLWQPNSVITLDKHLRINKPIVWLSWRAFDVKSVKIYLVTLLLLFTTVIINELAVLILKNDKAAYYQYASPILVVFALLMFSYKPVIFLYTNWATRSAKLYAVSNILIFISNSVLLIFIMFIPLVFLISLEVVPVEENKIKSTVTMAVFAASLSGAIVHNILYLNKFIPLRKVIAFIISGAIIWFFVFIFFFVLGKGKGINNYIYSFFAFLFPFFIYIFNQKSYLLSTALTCWSFLAAPIILIQFYRAIYPIFSQEIVVIAEMILYLAIIALSTKVLIRYKYWPKP
jgi:hypothetical protein